MELNETLIIVAAAALVAINIGSLTVGGLVVAALLGVVVLGFFLRKVIHEYGIYAFLVAELSPLGLQSQVGLAALYQAFSLLLLAAMLSCFQSLRPFDEYRSSLLRILVAASAFLGLTGVILYVKPLDASEPQLLALTTGSALAMLTGALLLEHYHMRFPQLNIRSSL